MPQVSILIRRVSLLASLFLLVCHLLSCNGTGGPATDPITLEVDSTNIGKVHFVIDNSGSMKGYVAVCDSICFKQQISDLLSRLDGIQKDSLGDFISLYTTSGKGSFEAYPGGIADFSIALSSPSEGLMGSHNSYLHITLDSLINKLEQDSILNEVGIFVTDGILSVPGKVNNKEYLPALSSQIQISLNRVKSKGYAVSIFQLFSEFQGSYWNFKNDRQQIQEVVQRPYYLVVLGNAKVLKKFYEEIIKPSLRDEINNQVSWQGKSQDSSIHYQVYSRVLQGTGVPSKDQKGLDQINFADNPPIFLVGLNGFAAPEYILQDSMLVKHLQGKPKIFIDTLEVFNRESFRKSKYISTLGGQEDFLDNHDLFVIVKMAKTEKSKDLSEIILSLENPLATTAPLPGWVVQFSTKDDSDLEEIVNGKTFGLQTLVDAFAKSLRDGEPKDYFSISINFNR